MQSFRLYLFLLPSAVLLGTSCVSTGKFKAMQQQASQYDSLYNQSMRTLQASQNDNKVLEKQKATLQDQANDMKLQLTATQENNSILRKEIQSISAISASQAESIKKSLDNMGARDSYMMALHSAVSRRDSANMALVLELKATIGGYASQGLQLHLQNGTVYVDLTDSLLFGGDTTSYTVTDASKQILSRMARVLNDQPAVEFIIEGHTDSLTDAQDSLMDSWDLSVKRAASIARIFQKQNHVSPTRITAAGRGEYAAAAATDSLEALAANRRTRFIFLPQMDQVLRLLDHRQGQDQPAPAAVTPAQPTPAVAAPAQTPPSAQMPPVQTTQTVQTSVSQKDPS
jgi:chemotaxis protein MotB